MSKKFPLMEMFGPTIQGEGAVIGHQTYFLRFGLCDYKCTMCDSMHAVDPQQVKANARWLTADDIYQQLTQYREKVAPNSTKWVTFSGGNPCIHDLTELVHQLKNAGWKIAVETQGTFHPNWLSMCDVVTCSPKGPGMGENCDLEVLDQFMQFCYENVDDFNLKVVVFDQRDLEFASMIFERYPEAPRYLSLGNPWPPGMDANKDWTTHIATLVGVYRLLFDDIQNDPILSQAVFLPQWHVFVWGNAKGK